MRKILIVDDDAILGELLGNMLESNGYSVDCALTGTEGLNYAKRNMRALIVLDIELPDINGIDVLKELKSADETKNIPVLMSSASDLSSALEAAKNIGAAGYITKPFKKEIILHKIVELVGK